MTVLPRQTTWWKSYQTRTQRWRTSDSSKEGESESGWL